MCFSNYLDSELLEILSLRGTFFFRIDFLFIYFRMVLCWFVFFKFYLQGLVSVRSYGFSTFGNMVFFYLFLLYLPVYFCISYFVEFGSEFCFDNFNFLKSFVPIFFVTKILLLARLIRWGHLILENFYWNVMIFTVWS